MVDLQHTPRGAANSIRPDERTAPAVPGPDGATHRRRNRRSAPNRNAASQAERRLRIVPPKILFNDFKQDMVQLAERILVREKLLGAFDRGPQSGGTLKDEFHARLNRRSDRSRLSRPSNSDGSNPIPLHGFGTERSQYLLEFARALAFRASDDLRRVIPSDMRGDLRNRAQRELSIGQSRKQFRPAGRRPGGMDAPIGFTLAELQLSDAIIEGRRISALHRQIAAIRFPETSEKDRKPVTLLLRQPLNPRQKKLVRQNPQIIHALPYV